MFQNSPFPQKNGKVGTLLWIRFDSSFPFSPSIKPTFSTFRGQGLFHLLSYNPFSKKKILSYSLFPAHLTHYFLLTKKTTTIKIYNLRNKNFLERLEEEELHPSLVPKKSDEEGGDKDWRRVEEGLDNLNARYSSALERAREGLRRRGKELQDREAVVAEAVAESEAAAAAAAAAPAESMDISPTPSEAAAAAAAAQRRGSQDEGGGGGEKSGLDVKVSFP